MIYHRSVRRRVLLVGGPVAAVLLLTGLLAYVRLRQAAPSRATPGGSVPPAGDLPSLSLPARVEPAEVVQVPAPMDGTIDYMPVNVGENVYEGQVLARIRDSVLELDRDAASADLNRARTRVSAVESRSIAANMEAARAEEEAARARSEADRMLKAWQRQQFLYREGAVAKLTVEQAEQEYAAASKTLDTLENAARVMRQRANDLAKELDQAQDELNLRTREHEEVSAQVASGEVVSPADGLVVARRGQAGEQVTVEVENLFEIAVNPGKLRAVAEPPPGELARIRPGQEVLIHVAELPDPIAAQVTEVRDGQVVVEFTSPSPALKPGMTAQMVIRVN